MTNTAFIGLPPIVDEAYDRQGTPGRACHHCNSAWPTSEGDRDPMHHASTCPWYDELIALPMSVTP